MRRRGYVNFRPMQPSAAEGDDDAGMDLGMDKLPSDVEAAIDHLRARCKVAAVAEGARGLATCPLVLQHHLYTIIDARCEVDREVQRLRKQNSLREFRLASSIDVALASTADYVELLSEAVAASPPPLAVMFSWFSRTVLPACRAPSVSLEELASLIETGTSSVGDAVTALVRAGFLRPRNASSAGPEVWHALPQMCHAQRSIRHSIK